MRHVIFIILLLLSGALVGSCVYVTDIDNGLNDVSSSPDTSTPDLPKFVVGQGTVDNPYLYWEENGYPDYVSFTFSYAFLTGVSEEGKQISWDIGVVNNNINIVNEIVNLLSPLCQIRFIDSEYSYNQRYSVYQQILSLNDTNIMIVSLINNSDQVLIVVSEDNLDKYKEMFEKQFGDIVLVCDPSAEVVF